MGTLAHLKQVKAASASASSSGRFQTVTFWETGIPIDSDKYISITDWWQIGSTVYVRGGMRTKFDNSTPAFDMTIPVTNGNPITNISGTVKKQRSTQQLNIQTAIFGGGSRVATHVGMTGSGIANTANETWDFEYQYDLT